MAMHVTFNRQSTISSDRQREEYTCLGRIISYISGLIRRPGSSNESRGGNGVDIELSDNELTGVVPYDGRSGVSEDISEILIKNQNEGEPDHTLGFQLRSTKIANEKMEFHHHTFKLTEANSPGKDMKLKDGDEFIVLGTNTLMYMAHRDVMNLLYNLTVDGQATTSLIIRRKKKSGKWKWLEKFVILAPGKDKNTKIQREKSQRVKKNRAEFTSDHVYRVPGTQQYMQIDNSGLGVGTFCNDESDKSKVIQRHTSISQDGDNLIIEVTLRDKTLGRYITIHGEKIVLSESPHKFKYSPLGNVAYFQNYHGYYLCYDHDEKEVTVKKEVFAFEEFPAPGRLK